MAPGTVQCGFEMCDYCCDVSGEYDTCGSFLLCNWWWMLIAFGFLCFVIGGIMYCVRECKKRRALKELQNPYGVPPAGNYYPGHPSQGYYPTYPPQGYPAPPQGYPAPPPSYPDYFPQGYQPPSNPYQTKQ